MEKVIHCNLLVNVVEVWKNPFAQKCLDLLEFFMYFLLYFDESRVLQKAKKREYEEHEYLQLLHENDDSDRIS